MLNRILRTVLFAGLAWSAAAHAQTWPTKPVRLVVPFAAGGGVDTLARTFATYYTEKWKQPVIVENKPGAGGQLAGYAVANAPPDGHTLLVASASLAASSALARNPTYDPVKDLAPVAMLVDSPSLFVVNPQVAARTVPEFIALAKSQPGRLNYGSTGVGSGPHLAMEIFKSMTGIDIVHVPFNGESAMYSSIFSNQVQASILAQQSGLSLVKAGRLRVLAVTAVHRSDSLPEVPSMTESGVPGFEYKPWIGILAPGKTPPAIIRRINADSVAILADHEIKTNYLPKWGSEATPGTPEAFRTRYLADYESYRKVVRDSKVPLND